MSDEPRRWSDDPDAPLALREALGDARADLPTEAQLASLAAKLGPLFGGGGGGGGGQPSGPGGGSGTASASGTAAGVATGTKVAVFLVGGSLLVATVGTWAVIADRRARPRQVPVATAEIITDGGATPPTNNNVDSSTREEVPVLAPLPSPSPSPSPTPSPSPSSVEAPSELTLLQGAQDALGADPGRALELLDAHRRAYPTGSLAQEREVLAIDALLRLGHRQRAEQRAARFRARYPTSGQIRRIETLLSES